MTAKRERQVMPPNGNKATPVTALPDFEAALSDYQQILISKGVYPEDAARSVDLTKETTRTRQRGNWFINFATDVVKHARPGRNSHEIAQTSSPVQALPPFTEVNPAGLSQEAKIVYQAQGETLRSLESG